MKKKNMLFISIMTAAVLLLSSCLNLTAMVADAPIKVMVNGKQLDSDVAPFAAEGRVLVPFRAIFEALGAAVGWDEKSSTALGRKGQTCIFIQPDNKNALIFILKPEFTDLQITAENLEQAVESTKAITLDVPAMNKNGRLLVPVRFIAESLGAKVDWDGNARAVIISTGGESSENPANAILDEDLIGLWSSQGPSGEMVDPATGYSTGSIYNGEWYLFRKDGTFRYVIASSGQIVSGVVVQEGKFTSSKGEILLTDVKESCYPDPSRKGQGEAYKNKSVEDIALQYRYEDNGDTLVIDNSVIKYYRVK